MRLWLKAAENLVEPLEVSFTIQRLRVSTTMQKPCLCHKRPVLLARVTFIAAGGQYLHTESGSLLLEDSKNILSPFHYHQRSVLVSRIIVIATQRQLKYP